MTALALNPAARPSPYARVSYRAFRIDRGRATELRIGAPATLKDALAAAQPACLHKEALVVRETDEDGDRLHLFVIKRKAPQWVRQGFATVRVQDLYADLVCVLPGSVFL